MLYKHRFFVLILILSVLNLYSQEDIELPQVIGPSPEVAALFHAQEFTINHSTGVPNIQIPLFTIKSGNITVPISLSYDASGRKVLQDNGAIAMDWILNVGGVVGKTIYGKPDSNYGRVPVNSRKSSYDLMSSTSSQRYDYLSRLFKTSYDNYQGTLYDQQYDVYSYSFAGLSGNFLFKNSYHSDPVFLNGDPLKMGQVSSGTGGTNMIEIINSDGIKYAFGGSGKVEHFKGNPSLPESNFVSSMRLSKISSWNSLDEVTFTYYTIYKEFVSSSEEYSIVDQKFNSYLDESMWNSQPLGSQMFKYDVTRIKEINFSQGKLVFVLASNSDMINAIQVKNNSGSIIKTIEFVRSNLDLPNYPGTDYMKKLDAIRFKDANGAIQEEYTFDYYNADVVKTYRKANRDWWGYKNNQSQTHLLPTYSIFTKPNNSGGAGGYINYGYNANRNPSDYVLDGVLKRITYPTKGKTEFEYEKNKYLEAGQVKTGPGLRVKKILDKNYNDAVTKTQRFEYSNGQFTHFYNQKPPNSQQLFLTINTTENLLETGYRLRKISSEDNTSMSFISSKPIFYNEVTKYVDNLSGVDNGKIVYKYDHKNSSTGSSFQNTSFSSPTGNLWNFSTDSELIQRCMYNYNYWDDPVLIEEAIYKNDGLATNGSTLYSIVQRVNYDYETIIDESLEGMMVEKLTNVSSASGYNSNPLVEKYAAENWNIPIYYYKDYIVEVGKKRLKNKTTKLYHGNSIVETTNNYEYNSRNQLKKETESTSSGSSLSSDYFYPYDTSFGINSKTGMSSMVAANRIAEPVYVRKFSNQDLIAHQWSTFGLFDSKLFKNKILWEKEDSSLDNMEEMINFYSYDNYGNPVEISKTGGSHIFYLWGYQGQYPIAKIENATKSALVSILGDLEDVNESDLSAINNLRSNSTFKSAMITTYTYKPLIGISSITDPRGRVTTYSYDDFGRLDFIKDHEGKLLEEYEYHYKGE